MKSVDGFFCLAERRELLCDLHGEIRSIESEIGIVVRIAGRELPLPFRHEAPVLVVRVLADEIVRHPESIGIGGAIRPSAGLKESPMLAQPQPYRQRP